MVVICQSQNLAVSVEISAIRGSILSLTVLPACDRQLGLCESMMGHRLWCNLGKPYFPIPSGHGSNICTFTVQFVVGSCCTINVEVVAFVFFWFDLYGICICHKLHLILFSFNW